MKYDIENQIMDMQGKYVEKEMQDNLNNNGFKKSDNGDYIKSIKNYSEKVKQVSIGIDESGFSNTKNVSSLRNTLNDLSKNFDKKYDKKIREAIADELIKDEDYLPSEYRNIDKNKLKKDLINNIGTLGNNKSGEIFIRVMAPDYLEVMYDDGGYYGNHILTAEYDIKKNKIMYGVSIEG